MFRSRKPANTGDDGSSPQSSTSTPSAEATVKEPSLLSPSTSFSSLLRSSRSRSLSQVDLHEGGTVVRHSLPFVVILALVVATLFLVWQDEAQLQLAKRAHAALDDRLQQAMIEVEDFRDGFRFISVHDATDGATGASSSPAVCWTPQEMNMQLDVLQQALVRLESDIAEHSAKCDEGISDAQRLKASKRKELASVQAESARLAAQLQAADDAALAEQAEQADDG
ncbi:hypothetical protein FOA52_005372 [Chlamydomonas sp. UWO 241]|nr:hypothetical protein FOA52_005372 [Chlamydomonas sp. UWO 241]